MEDENREQPSQERPAQRSEQWFGPWGGGLVLIVIGLVFLLRNLTGFDFGNWWAVFIAIPGIYALGAAWRLYEQNGQVVDGRVAGVAIGGAFPLFIAAVFLLGLDWGVVWPVFLILGGLAALAGRSASGK